MIRFREKQFEPRWSVALGSVIPALFILYINRDALPLLGLMASSFVIGFGVYAWQSRSLTTRIENGALTLTYGDPVPMFPPRRVPLGSIRAIEKVDLGSVLKRPTWTVAYGTFRERACLFYRMGGKNGVLVETADGDRILIGTQKPEQLLEALTPLREGHASA